MGDGPPGPKLGVDVSIAQPTCPPQSVIVARRPRRGSRALQRSRRIRLDDFGDRTLIAAISPARTTPLVFSTGPSSFTQDGPSTPHPEPPSARIARSPPRSQSLMPWKVRNMSRRAQIRLRLPTTTSSLDSPRTNQPVLRRSRVASAGRRRIASQRCLLELRRLLVRGPAKAGHDKRLTRRARPSTDRCARRAARAAVRPSPLPSARSPCP